MCRLSGKSVTVLEPQDAKPLDAQQVTDAFENSEQLVEEANIFEKPQTLETRNTIGTPKSETMIKQPSVSFKTEKCSNIHHETCAMQTGGLCDHSHHEECVERDPRISSKTRGGTEDGTASEESEKAESVISAENIMHDSIEKEPSQVHFENSPSSNVIEAITSHTSGPMPAAGKSDYLTSTVDPLMSSGETVPKPFQQADEFQNWGVDLTASKDRQNTSYMGPSTADALQTPLGGRQTEKGMREYRKDFSLIVCSLVRHVNWA